MTIKTTNKKPAKKTTPKVARTAKSNRKKPIELEPTQPVQTVTTTLTEDEYLNVKSFEDFSFYAFCNLKIKTKEGTIIPFAVNKSQIKLDAVIEEQRAKGKPVRIVILKPRQQGTSTYVEGKLFHLTSTQENKNTMVIAHLEDSTTTLFNMSKLFLEELPDDMRPMVKNNNAQMLLFENPEPELNIKNKNPGMRSRMKVVTAKGDGAGRGGTIHYLHVSELAFMPKPKETMTGLLQCVPHHKDTIIIVESTANGVGDYYHELYLNAKNGLNDFIPLFFPWFEHDEYSMEIEEGKEFILTDYELEIQKLYNLTLEQLNWRRWEIANNLNNDPELFKQEYPGNDTEAFLSSGRPTFNNEKLEDLKQKCTEPRVGIIQKIGSRFQFSPIEKGYLSVWKMPIAGRQYIIGADTAEGKEKGDFSSADVLDRLTKEQVAQWHGHIDPDLFAKELVNLAKFYNNCIIVPEINATSGGMVISTLKTIYKKIYKRKEDVDSTTNKTIQDFGWRTTPNNRPLIIDNLIKMVREDEIIINSIKTIEEMSTFKKNAKGKAEAQSGCHDDRVLSLCITAYVDSQSYLVTDEEEQDLYSENSYASENLPVYGGY